MGLFSKLFGNQNEASRAMASSNELSDDEIKKLIGQYIGEQNYGEALRYAGKYQERHPNDALGYFYRGSALELADLDSAVTAYEIAEQLGKAEMLTDRSIMMIALDRAICLYRLKRYDEALQVYEKWYEGVKEGIYDLADTPTMVYCLTLRRLDDYDKAAQIALMHNPVDDSNERMFDDLRREMMGHISPSESVFKL